MPIRERLVEIAKSNITASGSTHGGNGDNVDIENQSTQDLENNMDVDTLIDPEEAEGGSTHFSVSAKRKVKASPTEEQNIGTLDNDVEPAKGYIENASEGDADFDEVMDMDMDMDEDEVDASLEEELTNSNSSTPITVEGADEGEEDWEEENEWEGDDNAGSAEDDDIEEPANDNAPAFVAPEPEEVASDADEMSLMDIDEMDDSNTEDVHFATAGTRVMVIKANRIIASMTAKIAKASGREDVYLTDQFQEVTASEMSKKGMRKGLKSMGFVAAKVNVGKSSVVNAMVKKQVTKTTAAVRQVAAVNQEALEQSLAIAAVGINRGYFNKNQNELRSALEVEMIQAGMRNPKRLLTRVFASAGPAYAKQVMTLAQKIAAMPQESRDGYVEALDMTSEDMDEPDEEMIPIGAEDGEDEQGDFDDVEVATLATAGIAKPRGNTAKGNYSVSASAILSGDAPLFSL